MVDLLASMNSRPVFTTITAGGNAVWQSGNEVRQYQVTDSGAIRLGTNAAGQVYGSARGGDVYGAFPVYGAKNASNNNFDSSPDQIGNGALLLTTSVDQLGATLGKWFGLSDTQLLDVFPNLRHFGNRDLGFMTLV